MVVRTLLQHMPFRLCLQGAPHSSVSFCATNDTICHWSQANVSLIEACPDGHAVQAALPDSNRADCARMLGDLPPVPRSIDDFRQYLLTGTVALTPSFHSLLIAERPELQDFAFAAASENSFLAQSMTVLVRGYRSVAGIHTPHLGPFLLKDQTLCMLAFDLSLCPDRCCRSIAHAFVQFALTLKADL